MFGDCKIYKCIKWTSIQELKFAQSVCMASICYIEPISEIPLNNKYL